MAAPVSTQTIAAGLNRGDEGGRPSYMTGPDFTARSAGSGVSGKKEIHTASVPDYLAVSR